MYAKPPTAIEIFKLPIFLIMAPLKKLAKAIVRYIAAIVRKPRLSKPSSSRIFAEKF